MPDRPGWIGGFVDRLAVVVLPAGCRAQLLDRIQRRWLGRLGLPTSGSGGGTCDQGQRVLSRSTARPHHDPVIQDSRERSPVELKASHARSLFCGNGVGQDNDCPAQVPEKQTTF